MIANKEMERPPEDIGRLINELETSVNDRIETYLDGAPVEIRAEGYMPRTVNGVIPQGIRRVENTFRSFFDETGKEFTNIDVQFTFPLSPNADRPFTATLHWSNGLGAILAKGHGLPLILMENTLTQKTLASATPEPSEFAALLNSIGLPKSIHGAHIDKVITGLSKESESFSMSRMTKSIIDLETELEISHQARIIRDQDGIRQLVQELTLNVDHFNLESQTPGDDILIDPTLKYRNALVFRQTDGESGWKYHGAYRGEAVTGQLLNEVEQLDPQLGIPDIRLINKVLSVTTVEPY